MMLSEGTAEFAINRKSTADSEARNQVAHPIHEAPVGGAQ